jgi:hypothetical protein
MKTLLLIPLLCLTGCGGCAYHAHVYPLQPGETITFRNSTRADEFRHESCNDPYGHGATVPVTRPTPVLCE